MAKRAPTAEIYTSTLDTNVRFSSLQDQACSLTADRVLYERYISYLEARYDRSNNPCFVWEAIRRSHDRAINEFIIAESGLLNPFESMSREDFGGMSIKAYKHVRQRTDYLPDWCSSYLLLAASQISLLSKGLDAAKMPKVSTMSDFLAWGRHPNIKNDQASARLSSLLGFTKRGWNAFEEQHRERIALNFEQQSEYLTFVGLSQIKAYAHIAEKFDIDERTVRRLIAQGKRLIRELEQALQDPATKT